MALVPTIRVWTSGEIVLASYFTNSINGPLSFLLAPPIFKGYQTVSQSIPNNVFTSVTLDSEQVDSAGGHSTSTNTSRYTAQYAGWYDKGGGACFAASVSGRRLAQAAINGIALNGTTSGIPGNAAQIPWAYRPDLAFLNVNDFMEDQIFQDTGSPTSTFTGVSGYYCSMTMAWRSN